MSGLRTPKSLMEVLETILLTLDGAESTSCVQFESLVDYRTHATLQIHYDATDLVEGFNALMALPGFLDALHEWCHPTTSLRILMRPVDLSAPATLVAWVVNCKVEFTDFIKPAINF